MSIELIHGDCMDYMKDQPDNAFDLAIVDPPYGININMNQGRRSGQELKHIKKTWDSKAPNANYFKHLSKISNNQIIWGSNNFDWLPAHNGAIIWDKDITGEVQFSKAEISYCSMRNTVDMVRIRAQTGAETYSNKIHPTQKPIQLYSWLLRNYAEPGQRILDTHLGSGSSAIAAHYFGVDFVGIEIDDDYYKAAVDRFNRETAQKTLF